MERIIRRLAEKIKKYPNFDEEKKCWRRGCQVVVGLDEAGRGPLAGPVVAAAVYATAKLKIKSEKLKINDSKKLSPKQREEWYKILTAHPNIKWGIGIVSHRIIDRVNIFQATKLAMKKAVEALRCQPDFILLDGNFTLEDLSVGQKAIVRGDEKVFSCAAASIIAKVTRDRLMLKYAKKYPQYGFERHKGYGTRLHCEAIKKHGPCKIHRLSFRPIRNL